MYRRWSSSKAPLTDELRCRSRSHCIAKAGCATTWSFSRRVFLTRADHACAKIPPSDLDGLSVVAQALGEVLRVRSASDHIPVSARFFQRLRRHRLLRPPLGAARR